VTGRYAMKKLLCLGIESTAHTFGAAIASSDGMILSDIREVYVPPLGKGIHPSEAAKHHNSKADKVILEALRKARVRAKQLDAIAFSCGPGLGPCLRVGATTARALSVYFKKPLVPVNHALAHIEIGCLTTHVMDPLVILVSGGHTAIAAYAAERWRIYGETEDITIGNLFDMFARATGLATPGGPEVERVAREGGELIDLPYTVKGNDVAYSGLLSAALRLSEKGVSLPDLCFSLQEVALAMMAEASERSLAHTEKKELLLTGGVAANERFQSMLRSIAEEHGAEFCAVKKMFTGDSGAQIAWNGILAFRSGVTVNVEDSMVRPRWRLDQVKVTWRCQ
jgi:N6-L-threonylcarbamoyladenine synthase